MPLTLPSSVASGIGLGASMFKAATSTSESATGTTRTMVSYDTTRRSDSGFTVNRAAGTIAVPADGYYHVTAHARPAGAAQQCALLLSDGTNELLRSDFEQWASLQDFGLSGTTDWLTAGTALRLQYFSSATSSLAGNAAGTYYMFRVVRVG